MKEVEIFVKKMMQVYLAINNDEDMEQYDDLMNGGNVQEFINWINLYYENLTK